MSALSTKKTIFPLLEDAPHTIPRTSRKRNHEQELPMAQRRRLEIVEIFDEELE